MATTHYAGLKALALADERFENASVGLDIATMTPTFRLAVGIPGSSSAFAIAARYGLPQAVVERAGCFLSNEDRDFESLIAKLNAERTALELARGAAEAREREVEREKARLSAELEAARHREGRVVSREAEALLAGLQRAREELRAAQARLRSKKLDDGAVKEAARAIDRVAAQASLGGELESATMRTEASPRAEVRREELRRGARVYVPRLRAEAEVLEVSGSTVRVAVGPLKLMVAAEELRAAAEAPPPSRPAMRRSGARPVARGGELEAAPIQTEDNTCDLRGLRADDALSLATTFLDRSLNEGRRVAFLVHGHGTGALREVIRRELKTSPYVARYLAAPTDQGGEGVTIVWLS